MEVYAMKKITAATIIKAVLAALLVAAACFLVYYFRNNIRAWFNELKAKGENLLPSFCDCDDGDDFEDL